MMKDGSTAGMDARTSLVEKKVDIDADRHVVTPRSEMVPGEISGVRRRRIEQPARVIEREYSDVNKSAETFIQRFRKQLEIQRMESLENYESMLARGI